MATITPMPQVPANVKLVRKGDVDTFEFGLPALDKFTIDYTGIPEEKRSGIARALLSASALILLQQKQNSNSIKIRWVKIK